MALLTEVPAEYVAFTPVRIPSAVLDTIKHNTTVEELFQFVTSQIEALADAVGRVYDVGGNASKLVARVTLPDGSIGYYDAAGDRANFCAISSGAATLTSGNYSVQVQLPTRTATNAQMQQSIVPACDFGVFVDAGYADYEHANGYMKDQESTLTVWAELVAQLGLSAVAIDTAAPV